MDFGFISTPLFCIFLDLSAPLILVIVDNHSIRKRVSCKSKGIKFSTCSSCFVDFVSSSFFIRFYECFEAIWGSIWHHFWEKNPSENRFKKGGPPLENDWLSPCPMAPGDAASRARFSTVTIARARIQARFQLELELWLEFVSKFEFEIENLLEIGCLNWLRLQKFRKQFEKMERADIKTQCSWSDTPTGPRPGELAKNNIN